MHTPEIPLICGAAALVVAVWLVVVAVAVVEVMVVDDWHAGSARTTPE